METDGKHAAFESIVSSWYYDGEKMHDPLLLDHGKTETERDGNSGLIRTEGDKALIPMAEALRISGWT